MTRRYLNKDFLPPDIAIKIYKRKYKYYKNMILALSVIFLIRIPTVIKSFSRNKNIENKKTYTQDVGLPINEIDKYLQLGKISYKANITEDEKKYEVSDIEQLIRINNSNVIIKEMESLEEGGYKLEIESCDNEE
ncbi:hypothetical protein KQI77_05110 [Clostridium sp. MSJ-8]|uniref:hypothetical protein n=1 Tax=Clostridium sp. MSJ-8 TaxID=2841510 RepID=UPI001C0F0E04|nr:hypothetical protein [Clostridium sp. MSJ-8]MBU5487541.1 hypothetical protein [Clostridium sp. MSJ-8]